MAGIQGGGGGGGGRGSWVSQDYSDCIQACRIEKRENGNSFFWGGGRDGGSTSFKLSTTKDSQKLMIYIMQFSNFVIPSPRVSGSAHCHTEKDNYN